MQDKCEWCGELREIHLTLIPKDVQNLARVNFEMWLCDDCYSDLLCK